MLLPMGSAGNPGGPSTRLHNMTLHKPHGSSVTGKAPATRPALAAAETLSRKSVAPTGVFLFSLVILPPFVSYWTDFVVPGCGRGLAATPSSSPLIVLLFKAGQTLSPCFLKLRWSEISEHKKVHQSPRLRSLVSHSLFLSFSS